MATSPRHRVRHGPPGGRHGDIAPTSGDIGCDVDRAWPTRRLAQKRYQTAIGRPAGGRHGDIAPTSGATWAARGGRHGDIAPTSGDIGRARPARRLMQKRCQTAIGRPAGERHGDIAPTSGIGCDMGRLGGDMATSPRHRATSGATWVT